MPYKGDKGDKNAARPPEGSLVGTRCLIKGPKSAIVPFPGPRSGPESRTGSGASQKAKSRVRAQGAQLGPSRYWVIAFMDATNIHTILNFPWKHLCKSLENLSLSDE